MKTKRTNLIYCGDAAQLLHDRNRFPTGSVDLIMTSPPYGESRSHTYGGIPADKYVQWFLPIADELKRVLKKRGSFVLNIKERAKNCERETYVIELILELKKQGWMWIEEFCWYKKNSFPGKWQHRFRDSWERCLHFAKDGSFAMHQDAVKVPIGNWAKERFRSLSEKDFVRSVSGTRSKFGRNVSNWLKRRKVYPHNVLVFEVEHCNELPNLIQFATECSNRDHSAVYPLELPSWFIKLFTRKGGLILDPFIGSGTTAMAAVLLERDYIGIDVMPEYVIQARNNVKSTRRLMRAKNT